jgi:fructose-1,6-bisphosphatase/inositol monophosphatase family enzyme
MKKQYYIVKACRKDDRKRWRRYPVSGSDIADAAKVAMGEMDNLWEIVKIKVLR